MNVNLDIRPYKTAAIPKILELTQQTLGNSAATRKTEAFWRWKHQANPFGSSYGLLAWAKSSPQVAGLRVLMRWKFCTPAGHPFQAVRAVDTATHPAYQRQGIFSTLTRQAIEELAQEGVHFIFNTPNQYSLPGYLKLGWQVVAKWPVFIKVLSPLRMFWKRIKPGAASLPPDQFETYFGPAVVPWSTFVERYGPTISGLVTNWEKQRRQVGYRTPRDLDYLQWRYGQHPHLTYGVYALESADRLVGFAILRPNLRYGWQEIVLTDIFLSKPTIEQGNLLLKNLSQQLKGDYLVAHFAEGTIENTLLRQTRFFKIPKRSITFTVRPLNPLPQNLSTPAAWDLTLGDLEIF
jgi:GNAT superfamily N-acetyltransferase